MENENTELLKQLRIDDKQRGTSAAGTSVAALALYCLLSCALGGAGVYWYLTQHVKPQTSSQSDTFTLQQPAKPQEQTVLEPLAETKPTSVDGDGEKILDASGYITARRVATVSAEVMGRIMSVDVEEGMYVKQDQIIARLDDTEAQVSLRLTQAQVETHRANIRSLNVQLEEARRVLKRLQNLEKAGDFASQSQRTKAQSDVDKFIADIASARANLKVAQLQVEAQQNHVDDHLIRAPYDGVVTAKNAQPGEIISPSSAGGGFTRTGICTIVDMNSLEIEVDVNESFIGRVEANQKVVATLDAYPDWQIPASVIAIIPAADRAKATVRVRIKIEIVDPKILPDMSVKVSFFD